MKCVLPSVQLILRPGNLNFQLCNFLPKDIEQRFFLMHLDFDSVFFVDSDVQFMFQRFNAGTDARIFPLKQLNFNRLELFGKLVEFFRFLRLPFQRVDGFFCSAQYIVHACQILTNCIEPSGCFLAAVLVFCNSSRFLKQAAPFI